MLFNTHLRADLAVMSQTFKTTGITLAALFLATTHVSAAENDNPRHDDGKELKPTSGFKIETSTATAEHSLKTITILKITLPDTNLAFPSDSEPFIDIHGNKISRTTPNSYYVYYSDKSYPDKNKNETSRTQIEVYGAIEAIDASTKKNIIYLFINTSGTSSDRNPPPGILLDQSIPLDKKIFVSVLGRDDKKNPIWLWARDAWVTLPKQNLWTLKPISAKQQQVTLLGSADQLASAPPTSPSVPYLTPEDRPPISSNPIELLTPSGTQKANQVSISLGYEIPKPPTTGRIDLGIDAIISDQIRDPNALVTFRTAYKKRLKVYAPLFKGVTMTPESNYLAEDKGDGLYVAHQIQYQIRQRYFVRKERDNRGRLTISPLSFSRISSQLQGKTSLTISPVTVNFDEFGTFISQPSPGASSDTPSSKTLLLRAKDPFYFAQINTEFKRPLVTLDKQSVDFSLSGNGRWFYSSRNRILRRSFGVNSGLPYDLPILPPYTYYVEAALTLKTQSDSNIKLGIRQGYQEGTSFIDPFTPKLKWGFFISASI